MQYEILQNRFDSLVCSYSDCNDELSFSKRVNNKLIEDNATLKGKVTTLTTDLSTQTQKTKNARKCIVPSFVIGAGVGYIARK